MANEALVGIRLVVLGVSESRRALGSAQADMSRLESAILKLASTSATAGAKITAFGNAIAGVGRTLTFSLTVPLLAAGGSLLTFGIQFEDAFAGIAKTIEGVANVAADGSLALTGFGESLREDIRALAQEIPIAATELANIGQIAGQLGVRGRDNITAFIDVVAKMGVATNLSTEEAAFALARLQNIMGGVGREAATMKEYVERAAATIVALGNNTASTESEILNLSLRLSAAGRQAGLTTPEVLGLAATLAEMGVRAESGGTALSRAIQEMIFAIADGGKELQTFADITGQTTEEFAAHFKEDAIGSVALFIEKLAEAQEKGIPGLKDILEELGLSGVRVRDILGRLGGDISILGENVELANQAWIEQIALDEEAAKRFGTVKSQLTLLVNKLKDLGITLFDKVKGPMLDIIAALGEFLAKIKTLDPAVLNLILGMIAFAAALGPVLAAGGFLISLIGTLVSTFGLFLIPLGVIVVGIGLLAKQFLSLTKAKDAVGFVKDLAEGIANFVLSVQHGFDPLQAFSNLVSKLFERDVADQIVTTLGTVILLVQNLQKAIEDIIAGNFDFTALFPPELEGTAQIFKNAVDTVLKLVNGDITLIDLIPQEVLVNAERLRDSLLVIAKAASTAAVKLSVETTPIETGALDTFITNTVPALENALIGVSDLFADIAEAVAPFVKVVSDIALQDLTHALENLKISLANITPSADSTKSALEGIGVIVGTVLKILIILIALILGVVILAITSFITALSDGFAVGSKGLAAFGSALAGAIDIIRGAGDILIGFLKFIWAVILGFAAFVSGSEELRDKGATVLQESLDQIRGGFERLASGIPQLIAGMVVAIVASFAALAVFVLSLFGNFVADVIDLAVGLWEELVGGSIFPDIVTGITNAFLDLLTLPVELMGAFVTLITNKATEILTNLISGGAAIFTTLSTGVSTAFQTLRDNAVEIFQGFVDKIKELASGLGDFVKDSLGNLFAGGEGGGDASSLIPTFDTAALSGVTLALEGVQTASQLATAAFMLFVTTTIAQFALLQTLLTVGLALIQLSFLTTLTAIQLLWSSTLMLMLLEWQNTFSLAMIIALDFAVQMNTALLQVQAVFQLATSAIVANLAIWRAQFQFTTDTIGSLGLQIAKSVGYVTSVTDGLAGAFRNLGSAALIAAQQVCLAYEQAAECAAEAGDSMLGSPELKIQHPFETFSKFLKKTDLPSMIDAVLNPSINPAATVGVSPTAGSMHTIDNSINVHDIVGVPMSTPADFADFMRDETKKQRARRGHRR